MYYPQTRTPPIITSWFKVHLSDENYSHGTLKGVTRGVLPRHNGGLCPPNPPRLAAGSTPRCSLRSHTYGVGGGSYWKVVWGLVKGVTYGGAHTRNKDVPNTDASTKCYRPTWRTNSSVYLHICQVGFDPCFPLHNNYLRASTEYWFDHQQPKCHWSSMNLCRNDHLKWTYHVLRDKVAWLLFNIIIS